MTSPLIAGVLIGAGSLMLVWCIIAGAMFLAAGVTLALAYETRGNLETVCTAASRDCPGNKQGAVREQLLAWQRADGYRGDEGPGAP